MVLALIFVQRRAVQAEGGHDAQHDEGVQQGARQQPPIIPVGGIDDEVDVQEAQGPGKIDRAHVDRRLHQHEQHQRQRHVMAENANAHYAPPI